MSTTLPLRSELAMTFTGIIPRSVDGRAAACAARTGIVARTILILRRGASLFDFSATGPARAIRAGHAMRARPGGRPTSMPTGGRSCWRGAASWPRLRAWFAERGLRRGRDRDPAGLARQRGPSARLRDRARRARTARRRRSTCTPRRSSPARSCWRPASGGSSSSPASSATASAARCTTRSSPCSNGIAPASPTRR